MLHLSVFPLLSWCAGTRYWAKSEIAEARTMQAHVPLRPESLAASRRGNPGLLHEDSSLVPVRTKSPPFGRCGPDWMVALGGSSCTTCAPRRVTHHLRHLGVARCGVSRNGPGIAFAWEGLLLDGKIHSSKCVHRVP